MTFNKTSLEKTGFFAARLFGFVEIFILFGFQFFWVIYAGDLLYNESMWDLLALLGPIVIGIAIGFLCYVEEFRAALRKVEWLIHLLVCSVILVILLLVQIRNEFNPAIPYTWLFHFWLVFFGFVLVSNIVSNIDKPSLLTYFRERKRLLLLLGVGIIIWIITLGLVVVSRNPVFYWVTAIIYHAIMIPISLTRQYTDEDNLKLREDDFNSYRTFKNVKDMFRWSSIKKAGTLNLFRAFFRGFFLFILLVVSWNLWAFANGALGSIEDNYYLIYGIFFEPLFYGGMTVGIIVLFLEVKQKIRLSYLGDLIAIAIVGLSLLDVYFLAPFVMGYLIVMIFLLGANLNPISSAIYGVFLQITWLAGLVLFIFNGVFISFDITALINTILFGITGGLLGISLIFQAAEKILHRSDVPNMIGTELKINDTMEAVK